MHVVISENDESDWSDETGILYHFPNRYLKYLTPGTRVVYYKGAQKKKKFAKYRLTPEPHYFGVADIASVYPDRNSSKNDHFAVIDNFQEFKVPVLAKYDNAYIEVIPENRESNYWRDGARVISVDTYNAILARLGPEDIVSPAKPLRVDEDNTGSEYSFSSGEEGEAKKQYVTTYERDARLRMQAIAIHGDSCIACNFNFKDTYGDYAAGFIHIHHTKPVSQLGGGSKVDPGSDLVPLCPNCHAVVHRKKDKTLTVDELRTLISKHSGT